MLYKCMSAIAQRIKVSLSVRVDFDQAYHDARQINDPWFRSQALATVLRYAPVDRIPTLCAEAFSSAQDCKDAYQQVTVSSWIARALIERGEVRRAKPYLTNVLAHVRNTTPSPSEVEALFLLWNAVWIAPSLRQPTFALLLQACERANTWRAGRAMCDIVGIVAGEDPKEAEIVWERMPENRYKRQARRDLDTGKTGTVRDFFYW